jgi:hypothetical protein
MPTLLLPERCKQPRAKTHLLAETTTATRPKEAEPRRVIFHHGREEPTAFSRQFRASESHEHRYWGINE